MKALTLLADIPVPMPSTSEVGTWITVLCLVLAVAVSIKELIPKRRHPPIEAEFASKLEIKSDFKCLSDKLDTSVLDLNMNGSRRQREVFEELRALAATTNRHAEAIEHLKETSGKHGDAIDRLRERE